MPELPEVETVVRQLSPLLEGRRVQNVQIFDSKLRGAGQIDPGLRVSRVARRAKYIVLELIGAGGAQVYLAVHLRMTGALIWLPTGKESAGTIPLLHQAPLAEKHVRARIALSGGSLVFHDPRRFGTMELFDTAGDIPCRGVEPLSAEFSTELLFSMLKRSKQGVKTWLLRQDRLVGIGNIYASEILFEARISPRTRTDRLSRAQVERLRIATVKILERAIEHCGTSFSDFKDSAGKRGSFQNLLRVYEREGQPCKRCRAAIQRTVQQQRSTYFCRACQR